MQSRVKVVPQGAWISHPLWYCQCRNHESCHPASLACLGHATVCTQLKHWLADASATTKGPHDIPDGVVTCVKVKVGGSGGTHAATLGVLLGEVIQTNFGFAIGFFFL